MTLKRDIKEEGAVKVSEELGVGCVGHTKEGVCSG